MRLMFLLVACFLIAGCGALLSGSSKKFDITGEPHGTAITGDPAIGEYQVPTTLSLPRNRSCVLRFSKPGYKDATIFLQAKSQFGVILADIFLTGLIGVIVDAATGDWNGLNSSQTTVYLEKIDSTTEGPGKVAVYLLNHSKSMVQAQSVQVNASAPVRAKVENPEKPPKPKKPSYPFVVYVSKEDKCFHLKGCNAATGKLTGVSRKSGAVGKIPCPICFPTDGTEVTK